MGVVGRVLGFELVRRQAEQLEASEEVDTVLVPRWYHNRAYSAFGLRLRAGELVGAAGFEPTTTSPPDWCATRLRHAPTGSASLAPGPSAAARALSSGGLLASAACPRR
jgi:hypothetical protein